MERGVTVVKDMDTLHYQHQEAAGLRASGWTVREPGPPLPSLCLGADNKGCPVRTPRLRCHYCNNTLRLLRNERIRARRRAA